MFRDFHCFVSISESFLRRCSKAQRTAGCTSRPSRKVISAKLFYHQFPKVFSLKGHLLYWQEAQHKATKGFLNSFIILGLSVFLLYFPCNKTHFIATVYIHQASYPDLPAARKHYTRIILYPQKSGKVWSIW